MLILYSSKTSIKSLALKKTFKVLKYSFFISSIIFNKFKIKPEVF